jgi:uncharacterized SAM-binding protein YcdF (DUF218 family)/glycosyltransferase involved in cell wall biosynthesis
MLNGRDIVCVSSIDWDFIWQGHQQIMTALADAGNRVLFVENTGVRAPRAGDLPRLKKRLFTWLRSTKGFHREHDNLYVYSPLALPFPYSRLARAVNRLLVGHSLRSWMRAVGFSRPLFWTFLPTPLVLDLLDIVDPRLTIYYCIDNLAESSRGARRVAEPEERLLRRVDLVFTTSRRLYDRARRHNPNVALFPFGVDFEHFDKIRALPPEVDVPDDLRGIRRPIVGYVGGLHRWFDEALVADVAARLPDVSFVMVGPIQSDASRLRRLPNVHLLGQRSHAELPHYVRGFDVALVPYVDSDYTSHVYPTKLNEYLAMGKPVVATDLEEIRHFNEDHGSIVRIARDADAMATEVLAALRTDGDLARAERIAVAEENSWGRRIERMTAMIEERLEATERATERRWEERLLAFYRGSRRRLAVAAGTVLAAYALLFHTPVAWYAAEPLKRVDGAAPADAIVVLAGGVGESGLAGEGYQERVSRAVALYRGAYAPRMVIASGYSYLFREAEIMKTLAESLGVRAEAITLEERGTNTYESIKGVTAILGAHGARSVLLVSSPYHMRRASLTFRKLAPGVRVIHTPVVDSAFYARGRGITLEQIRGIVHEYAAILYYWWRGWI